MLVNFRGGLLKDERPKVWNSLRHSRALGVCCSGDDMLIDLCSHVDCFEHLVDGIEVGVFWRFRVNSGGCGGCHQGSRGGVGS